MISALIVDDEPLARERLRRFLAREEDVELIGECGDGETAVQDVCRLRPDLMFLDVELPEASGLDVLQEIPPEVRPLVVFVTAYDRYAIEAFDAHAIDYLLKPFTRERFSRAVDRVRQQLTRESRADMEARLSALLAARAGAGNFLRRLMIKTAGRIYFIDTAEIDWIGAEGNYLALHVGTETHLLRETMAGIAAKLDPAEFVRIHRSTVVNAARVKELRPLFSGDYRAVLRDGTQLNLSRAYREHALKLLSGAG
jgi:two-component system LytT family response regulator